MRARKAKSIIRRAAIAFALILAPVVTQVAAQEKGTLGPRVLPPLANPDAPDTPAKELFGRVQDAAPLQPDSIGFYSRGCLAGGEQLPIDGPNWQVMRPSRNRNWGHPRLVSFLKHFAPRAA
ncbi:MAG: penicillin-insensitive murein endopeptidase, partial [Methylocystis sp.]|nr:penicillin-insensitive murein endopeptidase [Methylocystis sp.]